MPVLRDPIGPLSACTLLYAKFATADVKTWLTNVKFCKGVRRTLVLLQLLEA